MGTGSWGTVFAKLLTDNRQQVRFWGSDSEVISQLISTGRNPKFQSDIHFNKSLTPTGDAAAALAGVNLICLAIPAQRLRANLELWSKLVPQDAIILSLIKGLEQETGNRVSQIVKDYLPNPFAVLSGPNLAAEIAVGQIAAATVAATEAEVAIEIQEICSSKRFKLFRTTDVVGVELAGTTKNIIALATGIVIGLGLGENAQAAILTRGLAEMATIGVAAGGKRETFLGLAGIGDLIATSQSPHSRNRSFGVLLGSGSSLDAAKAEIGQTVEAMKSTEPILRLVIHHKIEAPIISHVAQILSGERPAESILEVFDTDSHEIEHY